MKRVSVVLTNGLPLSFDAQDYEVNALREMMRRGEGVFSKLDFNIAATAVALMTVAEPDPEEGEEKTEEDGCNS